ncbi:MAG: prolyl oligopeptidase family serine peptidase [Anaerolineaceae bacterium]|nr:prolyl oligopeptidase family serine peptidase [Anaerolineaceae bacterium]
MEFIPLDTNQDAKWKKRYRAASIAWSKLASNNPAHGLVCTNKDGIYQLYGWEVASGALTQLTSQPAGVVAGAISADGEYVYYHRDQQGNELGHFVRVPFAGGEAEDMTPDMAPYASYFIDESHDGHVTGFLTASAQGFEIFVIKDGQAPWRIAQYKQLTFGPTLSYGGEIAVVDTAEYSGTLDTCLVAFDTVNGLEIARLSDGDKVKHNFGPFSPIARDMRILATTNISGYDRPLIWNPRTGERHDLAIDEIPGEVTGWAWSLDAQHILLGQIYQATYQVYSYDIAAQKATKLNHPSGVLGGYAGNAYYVSEKEIYTTWQDSVHPSRVIALDASTGAQTRTVLEAGDVPAGRKWKSVTFKSENGADIQGWLVTPEGDGPFPTILETHGGPTAVMSEFYSPNSQTWVDHGFAYFTINYHGSTTFGKDFEKSIWGKLGHLEVDDMAGACRWLVDNGIAQSDGILVTGWSYGGYLTLQSMGTRPELWAGGMAGIAIADWALMYEDQAETLRGYQRALFGGTPAETPEATRSSSPITYADKIRAPILVIQGSNDTRCPARQMRAYEDKMKSLGKDIQIEWFDAGHGSRAQEQSIHHQELMLRFAYNVLG